MNPNPWVQSMLIAAVAACCSATAVAQSTPGVHSRSTMAYGNIYYTHGTESGTLTRSRTSAVGDALSVEQDIGPLETASAASVTEGTLGARARTTFDAQWRNGEPYTFGVTTQAEGRSSWVDWLVITGGQGLGTATFTAMVEGSIDARSAGSSYPTSGVRFEAQYLPNSDPYGFPVCGYYGYPPCTPADISQGLGVVDRGATPRSKVTMHDEIQTDFVFEYGRPFGVSAMLRAYASDGARVDFSSTAHFALSLPEGAGIASASGYGYGVAAVPEPAEWACTALGLVLLMLRRDHIARVGRRLDGRRAAARQTVETTP